MHAQLLISHQDGECRDSYHMRLLRVLPFVMATLALLMILLTSRKTPTPAHDMPRSLGQRISKLEEQVREVSAMLTAADNDAMPLPPPHSSSPPPPPPPPPRTSPPPPPPLPSASSSLRSDASRRGCVHETAAARATQRYLLQPERLHASLPGAAHQPLHLTFATASVEELLTNWVAHVRRLHLPAVVAAMDQSVLHSCLQLRTHCLPMLRKEWDDALTLEAERTGQPGPSHVNIRGNALLFLSLGARKVEAILTLLDAGSGRPILVSDVDVVWLADPLSLVLGRLRGYEDFAHADVLASTDCLDPALDVRDHGCFNSLQVQQLAGSTRSVSSLSVCWQKPASVPCVCSALTHSAPPRLR